MEFLRQAYLDKLIRKKHDHLVKVVTGMRRAGKSYLIFKLFKKHLLSSGVNPSHIIEMNFDGYENLPFRNPDVFYPYIKNLIKDEKMYYILLDEIQMLTNFEAVLNSLMRLDNTDIYVTGSNARFLAHDVITEFRGRGEEIRIYPLSFSEFFSGYDGTVQSGYEQYSLFGGLPGVVLQKTDEDRMDMLQSLFEETYIRDVMERNRLEDKESMNDILNYLSSSIGSLTNPQRLANTIKSVRHRNISEKTIASYLSCLTDAFIISPASRFDIRGREYIGSPLKYYFTDLGLRNSRINFRQIEASHTLENIIFNELRVRGYAVDVGIINTSKRLENGASPKRVQFEIDFVCNKGSSRYYVQSALHLDEEAKLEQELRPLKAIPDSFRKIIVTKDAGKARYNEDGVMLLGINDFLLDPDSLDSKAL